QTKKALKTLEPRGKCHASIDARLRDWDVLPFLDLSCWQSKNSEANLSFGLGTGPGGKDETSFSRYCSSVWCSSTPPGSQRNKRRSNPQKCEHHFRLPNSYRDEGRGLHRFSGY